MTNPVHSHKIDTPDAWRGTGMSKEALAFDLSARNAKALLQLLDQLASRDPRDIRIEDCRHPDLDEDLRRLFHEIQHGRGAAILRGVPVGDGLSDEQIGKLFWILCTHLGVGVSQSVLGNVIGYVRDETPPGQPDKRSARGYLGSGELKPHSDIGQILGLLCARRARQGGLSSLVSALAVHNDFLEQRPDLLPILYRGWRVHRRGEEQPGQPPITPYEVPMFCNVGGLVSTLFVPSVANLAMKALGLEYSDAEREAIALFYEFADRNRIDLQLEPGEASMLNNLTMLHARTEYDDWDDPAKKRLMVRIWLDAREDVRPTVAHMRRYENKDGRGGIDPVPGRQPAGAEYNAR